MATQTFSMTTDGTSTQPAATPRSSTAQFLAILLMLAGWGWDNGQFVQPVTESWGQVADAIHLIPVIALILLALTHFRRQGVLTRGVAVGFTIIAVITIVGTAAFVLLGLTNPDPNSVGVHTFEDAMPAIVMIAGALLWLATLLRRGA
jgi:hypothetical protein